MKKAIKLFFKRFLSLILAIGICIPIRKANANPIALVPLILPELASTAFVTTLSSETLVAASASIVAVGIAAQQYIQSGTGINVQSALPKYQEEVVPPKEVPAVRGREGIRLLPPPPPEEIPPNEFDPNKIIPRTLPPYAVSDFFRDNRRNVDLDLSNVSPKNKVATSQLVKAGESPNKDEDIYDTNAKSVSLLNSKSVLIDPHPENRDPSFRNSQFSLDHFIHPSVVQSIFNGKRHEFKYDPSKRFDGNGTKWGVFNPDFVKAWVSQPDVLENAKGIKNIQKKLGESLNNLSDVNVSNTLKDLDVLDQRPVGFTNAMLDEPLREIETKFKDFDYHGAIESIRELRNEIREARKDPDRKELGEYWDREIRRLYIQSNGLLRELFVAPYPIDFESETELGNYNASKISHVLMVIKKLDAAWSYYVGKAGLLDFKNEENIKRIRDVAVGFEEFRLITDKVIGDLIEKNSSLPSKQEQLKNNEIIEKFIRFGYNLEKATLPLEVEVKKFIDEIYPKVFPDSKNKEDLDFFKNWRRLEESIKQGRDLSKGNDYHYGKDGDSVRAEMSQANSKKLTEGDKRKPEKSDPKKENPKVENVPRSYQDILASLKDKIVGKETLEKKPVKKEDSKRELTREEKVGERVALWKHRDLIKALKDAFVGKNLAKNLKEVFEVIDITSSEAFNNELQDKFDIPPSPSNSIRIKTRLKSDNLLLVRGYNGDPKRKLGSWFGLASDLIDPSGKKITKTEYSDKYDMEQSTKKVILLKVSNGQILHISLTSGVLAAGQSNQIQVYIDKKDLNNFEIINEDFLE